MEKDRTELNQSEMERCARWLKELDVDPEGVEIVLHLREQVLELQEHVRHLEAELGERRQTHARRLTLYHETYYEATWWAIGDEGK